MNEHTRRALRAFNRGPVGWRFQPLQINGRTIIARKTITGKIKEATLAKCVVHWLIESGWSVFQEVRQGGVGSPIVDIVAKKVEEDITWAIECKGTFNLDVIAQADNNKRFFNFSSVAIPAPSPARFSKESRSRLLAKEVCRERGIGILEVTMYGDVEDYDSGDPIEDEVYKVDSVWTPKPNRTRTAFMGAEWLHNRQKEMAPAGTKGGGYYTPYKAMMEDVKAYIKDNPGCVATDIIKHLKILQKDQRALGDRGYCLPKLPTLQSNLMNIEKWCLCREKGRFTSYYVTESGG